MCETVYVEAVVNIQYMSHAIFRDLEFTIFERHVWVFTKIALGSLDGSGSK